MTTFGLAFFSQLSATESFNKATVELGYNVSDTFSHKDFNQVTAGVF